jgi:hypothetical protein
MHQDLTVQHITEPFCMIVDETHAKLAIEQADLTGLYQSISQWRRGGEGRRSDILQYGGAQSGSALESRK